MHQARPTFKVRGAAIRTLRMRAGLEMKELAERIGISRRYLNHLELGYRKRMKPGPYTALRNALNATDEDLLAPPEEPPTDTPQEER